MKLAAALAGFLLAFSAVASAALAPIVVKSNALYKSDDKTRFFVKGITYDYAVDDTYYAKYGQKAFTDFIAKANVNTVRVYSINPDLSYDLFMQDMQKMGIYVLVSAAPGGESYFGDKWTNCPLARFSSPAMNQPMSCYPSCLLEYGKNVAAKFAKYDNTLGLVIGNEVSQFNATSLPCVKQYAQDLKSWMNSGADKMRSLPIAYADADTAPEAATKAAVSPTATSPDVWNRLKFQFLTCEDKFTYGGADSSIDIIMLNAYRWCDDQTGPESYDIIKKMFVGTKAAVVFGEYDCAKNERLWNNVKYLFSPSMTDVFSGGFAYSFGAALLSADFAKEFPLITGGDVEITGFPGATVTTAFTNLAKAYGAVTDSTETGTWSNAESMCKWAGKGASANPAGATPWTSSCSTYVKTMSDYTKTTVTWPIDTREDAACDAQGAPCPVAYPSGLKNTGSALCGGKAPDIPSSNNGNNSGSDSNNSGSKSSASFATTAPSIVNTAGIIFATVSALLAFVYSS